MHHQPVEAGIQIGDRLQQIGPEPGIEQRGVHHQEGRGLQILYRPRRGGCPHP
ncbi:hypothetical protein D3C87_1248670 [compost metagenome]